LAIDLDQGGSGASVVQGGVVPEEFGRTLLPFSFLPAVVSAAILEQARKGGSAIYSETLTRGSRRPSAPMTSRALRPSAVTAVYAAAKSGLEAMTRALALEWGPKVRVNLVTSGLVETEGSARHYGGDEGLRAVCEAILAGRMPRPEEIGAACLALAAPGLEFSSGAELRVDGGGDVPGWLVALRNATE
jgi:NAD(P)-dependent dehydrogenase (short-subunit alcohol dehydrogenase family)